jgi:hypothetical protein
VINGYRQHRHEFIDDLSKVLADFYTLAQFAVPMIFTKALGSDLLMSGPLWSLSVEGYICIFLCLRFRAENTSDRCACFHRYTHRQNRISTAAVHSNGSSPFAEDPFMSNGEDPFDKPLSSPWILLPPVLAGVSSKLNPN